MSQAQEQAQAIDLTEALKHHNIDYPAEHFLENYTQILRESNLKRWQQDKLIKRIKKLKKRNNLAFPKMDAQMIWRLCAADLMNGHYSRWLGFEYRSQWALDMARMEFIWPKWNGQPCHLLVMGEQGIGDEILFASVYDELLSYCPDAIIECDDRLQTIFERSFCVETVSRWDTRGKGRTPAEYIELSKKAPYDKVEDYVPAADALKMFRTLPEGTYPPGDPYLECDMDLARSYREMFEGIGKPPYIGISWQGGRSKLDPHYLKKQKGTYINLQYAKKDGEIVSAESPEWVHDVSLDHNNMEEIFACCKALHEVNTVQNYIVHVCGSQGIKCNAVKPPPIYGDVGTDDSENNRLKWPYGRNKVSPYKMPWYNSVDVYESYRAFQSH
jgi:hypothetical protein